jgi:hypothetical protein
VAADGADDSPHPAGAGGGAPRPEQVEGVGGGGLRLEQALQERAPGGVGGAELGGQGRQPVEPAALGVPAQLGGGRRGGGDGPGRRAADAPEPVVGGDVDDRCGVDDAAGDAALHHHVALEGEVLPRVTALAHGGQCDRSLRARITCSYVVPTRLGAP